MSTPAEIARQAEQLDDERWYDFLDEVDEASRRRRQRAQSPDRPTGTGRDEVAAWLAKKHLIADGSIREVRYLPAGAPADEVRLLEVSDRLATMTTAVEAIDFGVEIGGAGFCLNVADISSEQLRQIEKDSSLLPAGWSLDGSQIWRRRG